MRDRKLSSPSRGTCAQREATGRKARAQPLSGLARTDPHVRINERFLSPLELAHKQARQKLEEMEKVAVDEDELARLRACAEELGHTFLPCVLVNLGRAPSLVAPGDAPRAGDLWRDDIDAIVVPADACGPRQGRVAHACAWTRHLLEHVLLEASSVVGKMEKS